MKLITQSAPDQEPRKLPPTPFFVIGKDSGIAFIVTEAPGMLPEYLRLSYVTDGGKLMIRPESRLHLAKGKGYRFPLPGEKIVIKF